MGDPNKPGAAGKLLTEPKGVVCSQGVLYVTDAQANRVVAFSEKDGSPVGEFKATAPNFIGSASRPTSQVAAQTVPAEEVAITRIAQMPCTTRWTGPSG